MIVHLFAFRWRPATTQDDKNRALHQIRSFSGRIPGLLEVMVGVNLFSESQGHELGGAMKFVNKEALKAYNETDPTHRSYLSGWSPS